MRVHLLIGSLLAVTAFAIVAGVIAIGSPAAARERRLDQRRVDDLVDIDMAIHDYQSKDHSLPGSLRDLQQWSNRVVTLRDPSTQQSYEYRTIDSARYELCAVFQQPSRESARHWMHGSGRQCFSRKATEGSE